MVSITLQRLLPICLVVLHLAGTSVASALPILPLLEEIPGLGTEPPPEFLLTTEISPQCAAKNKGTYLCCSAAVDGGNPIVAGLANAAHYTLPANTVNGLVCK